MKGSKFGGKDAKAGGRVPQKSAGAAPKGRPSAKMGGDSRGEFDVETGGTVAGGLGKRAEFATERAGS